jgi:hypothetical protein
MTVTPSYMQSAGLPGRHNTHRRCSALSLACSCGQLQAALVGPGCGFFILLHTRTPGNRSTMQYSSTAAVPTCFLQVLCNSLPGGVAALVACAAAAAGSSASTQQQLWPVVQLAAWCGFLVRNQQSWPAGWCISGSRWLRSPCIRPTAAVHFPSVLMCMKF